MACKSSSSSGNTTLSHSVSTSKTIPSMHFTPFTNGSLPIAELLKASLLYVLIPSDPVTFNVSLPENAKSKIAEIPLKSAVSSGFKQNVL